MLHKIKDIKICVSFCAQYSYQNETTTKKSLMFEHKGSVQHSKDGGRAEHTDTRSRYKTNRPPFYAFSADRNG